MAKYYKILDGEKRGAVGKRGRGAQDKEGSLFILQYYISPK
jgi:hypothetical protein